MNARMLVLMLLPSLAVASNSSQIICGDPVTSQIFGVDFRLKMFGTKASNDLCKTIELLRDELSVVLDPDCRWRGAQNGACSLPDILKPQVEKAQLEAKRFQHETQGYFDVNLVPRDFAGMGQGYFMDHLKSGMRDMRVVMDFAGDVFSNTPEAALKIADPQDPLLTLAELEFSKGWMMSSYSALRGGDLRNPKNKKAGPSKDFDFVVLFAKESFSGARLDAWSTAAMVGGLKVLRHLMGLKEFREQWGFVYMTPKGRLVASSNIQIKNKAAPYRIKVLL